MREILFRGKSINTGEWIESMTIANGTIKRKKDCVFLEAGSEWIGVIPDTVGQFTGLTDKNGNKVFEGDILHVKEWKELKVTKEYTTDVIWEDCAFAIKTGGEDYDAFAGILSNPFSSVPSCEVEIIGNIHEQR